MRIEIQNLVVRYGKKRAVDGVSFKVDAGAVFALLGRNGAGKTSLVRVLLGQRRADGGMVAVGGLDPWRQRLQLMARVGAAPESPDAPAGMRVVDLLRSVAPVYPRWNDRATRERLERFAVPAGTRFGELSRGQRSLVMLALALAPEPELLVLDDPTLGLDPVARRYVFGELIRELSERKTTVFLTSHDLEGAERVATHVGILAAGRLTAIGELEDLRAEALAAGIEEPSLEEIFLARDAQGGSR